MFLQDRERFLNSQRVDLVPERFLRQMLFGHKSSPLPHEEENRRRVFELRGGERGELCSSLGDISMRVGGSHPCEKEYTKETALWSGLSFQTMRCSSSLFSRILEPLSGSGER